MNHRTNQDVTHESDISKTNDLGFWWALVVFMVCYTVLQSLGVAPF